MTYLIPTSPLPPISTLFPYTTLFRSRGLPQRIGSDGPGLRVLQLRHDRQAAPLYGEHGAAEVPDRSEEHTSELQSHVNFVCRLLLEKKKASTELGTL